MLTYQEHANGRLFILVAVMASLFALVAIVCFIRRALKPTPRYEEEHYD